MNDAYNEKLSRNCFYVCLGLWIGGLILYGVLKGLGLELTQLSPYPCIMLTLCGVYCPGCGGTRAIDSLLHGKIWQSLIYHPLVLYVAILTMAYMISHTLNIVTKGKIKAMQFRAGYLFLMLGILLVQWLRKNILKFAFGVIVF